MNRFVCNLTGEKANIMRLSQNECDINFRIIFTLHVNYTVKIPSTCSRVRVKRPPKTNKHNSS